MADQTPATPLAADLAEAISLLRTYFPPGRMQDLALLAADELDRRGERIAAAFALSERWELPLTKRTEAVALAYCTAGRDLRRALTEETDRD